MDNAVPNEFSRKEKSQYLLKTSVCSNFMRDGVCKYGLSCQFAHGEHELRERHKTRNFKTKLCRNLALTNNCPYGDKCTFLHDPKEIENTANDEAYLPKHFEPNKYKTKPCMNYFNFGFCQYGDRCTFSHELKDQDKRAEKAPTIYIEAYQDFVDIDWVDEELLNELRAKEQMYFERKLDWLNGYGRIPLEKDHYVEDESVYYFSKKNNNKGTGNRI
eukprot:GAHX01001520.1.p1 GENE.GAHX01001520.1~~GAHX01001520.1.p1  ORF type:complete len:217 (-),score=44.77 GAHX01001520.1:22-672(-)